MRDLNFFEPYIEKKEFKIGKESIFYFIILVCICFFVVHSILNHVKISKLNKENLRLKDQVENERDKEKVEKLLRQEEEINLYEEKMGKIRLLEEKLVEDDLIDEELLPIIATSIPDSIFLESVDINNSVIEINGVSRDKYSIADFQNSLKKNGDFLDIFISNIATDNVNYKFSLTIKLKDEEEKNSI